MNSPLPEDQLALIQDALFQGRKIEAIKLHRKFTSSGLADAKDAVENIEQQLRVTSPEKFATTPQKSGCLGVVTFACIVAALILFALLVTTRS